MKYYTGYLTVILMCAFSTMPAFGFIVQITVTRIVSGNTVVTSDDEFVHIVGENINLQPYIFTCKEPEATDFARSNLLNKTVSFAYRGRHETGVQLGVVLVDGKQYPDLLQQSGLLEFKSPDAFAERVANSIRAPSHWMRTTRVYKTRRPTILGEFYRGMADYMSSLKFSGSSDLERDYNSSADKIASEFRKVANVADKPWNEFTAKDARSLWDSAIKVNQTTDDMQERVTEEWNSVLGFE